MIELRINGHAYPVHGGAQTLAQALREDIGLLGTKVSCGEGECGSCTVLLDGRPVTACLVLAEQAKGREIETIEGVGHSNALDPIQQAFVDEQGFQCGACTPGFIMAAKAFLSENSDPSVDETSLAMSGNICRCGAHPYIVRAVMKAAETLRMEEV